MKDFMMLFHEDMPSQDFQPTPEQMQEEISKWQNWIGGIAAQGKLKATEGLLPVGKTIHADQSVTDGPYAETKEIVGGFLICSAESLDEALALGAGCPIFGVGGKLEVREVMVVDF